MNPNKERRKRRLVLSCSKKLSALLRGMTSNYDGDVYCLNYLHSFRTKNNLSAMKNYVKIKMPEDNRLEFNQYMKSDKMPYIVYADIEY